MARPLNFEQGPIRPPSESRSLLIRTTRGCPWNQCRFCSAYTHQKFSLRTVEEVKDDIRTISAMIDEIQELSLKLGCGGQVTPQILHRLDQTNSSYMSVAMWLCYGTGDVFLQDGDNLIMKTEPLVEVLAFLRETIPMAGRITTYSRTKTISRKTVDQLQEIRKVGVDRVHVGLESGSNTVLDHVKKGATKEVHIEGGRKAIEAGMELSVYVIPGLGGTKLWREHALETADVLNRINPHFIRLRSLRVPDRIPLFQDLMDGSFEQPSDDQVVREIRLLIESLQGISSTLASDHILNILGDVEGRLPEDKGKMLAVIDEYEALSAEDKIIFRIGRRGGTFNSLSDLETNSVVSSKISALVKDIRAKEGEAGVEALIKELADKYS